MDVLAKLQVKPGTTLGVLAAPADSPVSGTADPAVAAALLAFVVHAADLADLEQVVAAAAADRLTWIAYPKAGRLGTDLDRDSLAAAMVARGLRPVRQVALDDTWSALRFRPGV